MSLKLIVCILVIAIMPRLAQAQSAVTNEDAQQLVETIKSDPDKSQAYCDSVKLSRQIDVAEELGKNTDEMKEKIDKSVEKLGPEWATLMTAYRDVDLDTRAGLETAATVQRTFNALNELCGPLPNRRD